MKVIQELIANIKADAKFTDSYEDIEEYAKTIVGKNGLTIQSIKQGYVDFKKQKNANELFEISKKHNLNYDDLENFLNVTIKRMIFDSNQLRELLAPLELGWKERSRKELELVKDLLPLLKKLTGEREISGLKAYE